jgi:hypothetical protein
MFQKQIKFSMRNYSPVYTTLNFWYGTDKIGTRTTFFGSWTIYLAKPRLHYPQFLVPYHFLVLGLPKHIISSDEDPGLRIESFAVINLRGVSTKLKYDMFYRHFITKNLLVSIYSKNKVIFVALNHDIN